MTNPKINDYPQSQSVISQTELMQHAQFRINDDDGVDLKQLIVALWRNKVWIIGSTIICVLLSICYALFAEQWWSSTAKVDSPQISEYASFYKQAERLNQVFKGADSTTQPPQELVELNSLIDSNTIFTMFVKQFDSRSNKKDFLLQQKFIQDLLAEKMTTNDKNSNNADSKSALRNKNQIQERFLANWLRKIMLIKSKDPTQTAVTISFQTTDSEQSFELLQNYITFVNKKVNSQLYADLQLLINNKKDELSVARDKLFKQIDAQLQSKIALGKYSVDIAKAANIDKPLAQFAQKDSDYFHIGLGVDGLQAQIKALTEIYQAKNYQIVMPQYKDIDDKVNYLAQDKVDDKLVFQTYTYIDEPEQNPNRDKPNRSLVVVLGLIFGFMFGVVLVLIINSFRRETANKV